MSYRRFNRSYAPVAKTKAPPAEVSLDQHISASIDFAANDVYASQEINMPDLKEGYYAVIHDVEWEITDYENMDADVEGFWMQLTDEEETAILFADDEDLVIKDAYKIVAVGAAATAYLINFPKHKTPKLPILYPHKKIYLGCQSAGAGGAAGTLYVRIHYTVKQISDFMVNMVMKKK